MSAAKIRRELDMLQRVFAPRKKVRMDVDYSKLNPHQKKTLMDAGKLGWRIKREAEAKLGHHIPFNEVIYDPDKLTARERLLLKEAHEIWEKYKEPESDIRARQPPIH